MAVLAIHISAHVRHYLGIALILLHFSLAMMYMVLIGMGIVLAVLFSQQKDMLKNFGYKKHTHFIIFSGIVLISLHVIGAKLCYDCGSDKNRLRALSYMLPFTGLLFAAFILDSALSISCSTAVRSLQKGHEKGFREMMERYDADKDMRKQIDFMQVSHKCCGSTNYKDWLEIPWHSEEYIRPELKSKKGRGVPFTCCDPSYMGPCIHDAGDHKRPGYKAVVEGKAYYSNGCSEAITETLRWLMAKLATWLLFPLWLELVALTMTKYLHSSSQNAIDNGDEEGMGYGFLMDKCPVSCLDFLDVDIYAMQMKRKLMKGDSSPPKKKKRNKKKIKK